MCVNISISITISLELESVITLNYDANDVIVVAAAGACVDEAVTVAIYTTVGMDVYMVIGLDLTVAVDMYAELNSKHIIFDNILIYFNMVLYY